MGLESLVDLFRCRAAGSPAQTAYVFLENGEAESARLTYAELDLASRAIAARLQRIDGGGGRALLVYSPGLEFVAAFVGCLYAGVVAVPIYPPNPARPAQALPKLLAIARDARAGVVLTNTAISAALEAAAPGLASVPIIATDRIAPAEAGDWRPTHVGSDRLAFLQYTSGSTAAPRGVMVTHGNLIQNLAAIYEHADNAHASCSVSWLPLYHDMGLIGGILQAAYAGFPAYLMSPLAFLERPVRWLAAISRYRASNSGAPNFAYDLCARRIMDAEMSGLDLRCWRIAYNGAEPIRADTLERFAAAFAGCGFDPRAFRPAYGLAEATLLVASVSTPEAPRATAFDAQALARDRARPDSTGTAVRLVSCGTPARGTDIAIVDPQRLARCAPGEVGEIWVRSPSVACGYWDRAAETRATFSAQLDGCGEYLRSGDLGFVWDGELYVTGRIKDLIIVRGRKLYPQDIEQTVMSSHSAVREGCVGAFACPDGEADRIGVAAEVIDEIEEPVLQAVIEHGVQCGTVILLARGTLPKTTSGKLRRHAARAGFLEGTLRSRARWSARGETAAAS
jgi:acyl-CoA synthetase (AMP-forming)/AMP-acid ligase II